MSRLRRLIFAKPKEVPNYLCFTALEDTVFTFTIAQQIDATDCEYVEYSIDDGASWVHTDNIQNQTVSITTPTILEGDKVLWRGIGYKYSTGSYHSKFSSTNNYKISGNIASLIFGKDFKNAVEYRRRYATNHASNKCIFQAMFNGSETLIDASELVLPNIGYNYNTASFYGMFEGCTNLQSASFDLPTTISERNYNGQGQYQKMFYGCTSLVEAPVFKMTSLNTYQCSQMFYNCTSLEIAPDLRSITDVTTYCFCEMFRGCTSLIQVYPLSSTTMASSCYQYMFYGCTSLVNTPELPAMTLANNCYYGMFRDCTALTNVPTVLPATTLAPSCYHTMFYRCTSLEKAPELPATTLETSCYHEMFRTCSSLNYIKMMATEITLPSNTPTSNWVLGVSASGTFIMNQQATWYVIGGSGIPTGWTWFDGSESLQTPYHFEDQEVERNCIEHWGGIMGGSAASDTRLDNVKRGGYQDGAITKEQIDTIIRLKLEFSENTLIETFNELGDFINLQYIGNGTANGFYHCTNLREVILPNSLKTINDGYVYSKGAFMGTAIESIYIPDSVTTMGDYTFADCTSLKTVRWSSNLPVPASNNGYYGKTFNGCTSLEEITNYPANVKKICPSEFKNCISLDFSILDFSKIVYIGGEAFYGCTQLPESMIFNSLSRIYNYAFRGSSVRKAYFPMLQNITDPNAFGYAYFTLIDLGEYFGGAVNLSGYTANTCTVVIRNSDSADISAIQNNVKKVYVPSASLSDYQSKFTGISTKIFEIGGTEWVADFGGVSEWADYPNGQAPTIDTTQHQIEYIKPIINTIFDTGITPTVNTHMIVRGRYAELTNAEIAGTVYPSNQRFHIGTLNKKFYFGAGNTYKQVEDWDTDIHTFELYGNGTCLLDDNEYSIGASLGTATTTITLLGQHNNATTGYSYNTKFETYSAKIYENDVLIKDYVPYRYMGGIYFKDKVSGALEYVGNEENFFIGNDVIN